MNLENKSKITKQVYELCLAYSNYEKFINNQTNNYKEIKGYLIENNIMEEFKKIIFYEKLKDIVKPGVAFSNIKDKIEENELNEEIKKIIVQSKFINSNELIKELNNNKKYYLINEDFWKIICKEDNKDEIGIKVLLTKKDIILFFKEDDKLMFINNNGIIEKSSLNNNLDNNENKNGENPNNNNSLDNNKINVFDNNNANKIDKNESNNNENDKYKNEIEILIKLNFYSKKMKDFVNQNNDENKNLFYLINKNWINEFKNNFNYETLKQNLNQKNYFSNTENVQNIEETFFNNDLIKKIIANLPNEYFDKINNSNKIKLNHNYEFEEININNKKLIYLINYQIINKNIYDLLLSNNYLKENQIKKCKCIYLNNNKIFIKFELEENKYIDEIGYIDINNTFIPQYLLYYNNNNINYFMKNEFEKFCEKEINYCEIKNENNINIGFCYKINNVNINEKQNKIEKNENETKNNELKKDEIFLKYEKEFDILISFYYNKDFLKEELEKSIKEGKIDKFSCYFINKEWFDFFKKLFFGDKFYDYLKNKNYNLKKVNEDKVKKFIIKDFYKLLTKENDFNFEDFENKKQKLNEYQISPLLKKINLSNNNEVIYFFEKFYIINDKIFQKINYLTQLEEQKIIINNGKIIFNYEYSSSLNNNKFYNILIGNFNIDNNLFIPEIILDFKEKENERNSLYNNIFLKTKNTKYNLNTKEIYVDLNGRYVGKIYKLNPNNSEKLLLENNSIFKTNNKYIELMINIYLFQIEIKNKINNSINKNLNPEKYNLVNGKWIKELLIFLEFDNFNEIIKKNDIYNILIQNKNQNDNLFDKIISFFPSNYMNN